MKNQNPNKYSLSAIVAFGSNEGDRTHFISQSLMMIERDIGPIVSRSNIYKTAPIGAANQEFLNGAALIKTNLQPHELLTQLLHIEHELGRTRYEKWGNRTIDLDIVVANDFTKGPIVLNDQDLILPHPESLLRDFVLVPASEVSPSWIHPSTGNTLMNEVQKRGYTLGSPVN